MINDTLVMEDSEYCFLAPRGHGEFSQIGEKSYMSKMLLEEGGMVGVVVRLNAGNYYYYKGQCLFAGFLCCTTVTKELLTQSIRHSL